MTLEEVYAWRKAAIADGWKAEATYQTEDISRAMKLTKDGFLVQTLTRPIETNGMRKRSEAVLCGWGPDKLQVHLPVPYDMEKIRKALRRCDHCRAEDVDTQRYSFAGRCCAACLPKMKAIYEKPGWTR